MVFPPDKQLPEKIMGMMKQAIQDITVLSHNKIGDQDIVNAYYSDWIERQDLHLDQGFNIFFSDLDAYIFKHGYQMNGNYLEKSKNIHVIHFVGPHKPWMKWARIKHFLESLRKKGFTRFERRAFSMYCVRLKNINLN